MKKKTVTCIVVSASVLVVALFFVFLSFLKNLTNPVDYNYGAQSYPYMVQEYNGKIGVFRNNEKTPFQVVDLSPALLPPYDQAALEEGIPIRNESELQRILEDYAS